jgi:N-acetylmuramoyl-L-alanine amidase
MNSYGDPKYSGLQAYYSQKNDSSRILAESIQSTVKEEIQNKNNRNVKPGKDIYLLENTPNVSVLVECGFLTNPEECQKLSEKEYQKRLSLAIVCGIIRYKERQA